jgi:hypothetical protein
MYREVCWVRNSQVSPPAAGSCDSGENGERRSLSASTERDPKMNMDDAVVAKVGKAALKSTGAKLPVRTGTAFLSSWSTHPKAFDEVSAASQTSWTARCLHSRISK